MNKFVAAILLAAASWAVQRYLTRLTPPAKPKQLDTWENEGGALAPQQLAVETSQVPR